MKTKIIYSIIIFVQFILSCKAQDSQSQKIDSTKVDKITIVNKVYCCSRDYGKKRVEVTFRERINSIIDAFSYAKPIKQTDVRLNANNGFFEIEFSEDNLEHTYNIVYTIYDGIVIVNMNGGDSYKNDHLEYRIYSLFLE